MSTQNNDIPYSDISQNSDTLFAFTKMSLFLEEDFAKKPEMFSKSENDFSKILNKKANANTGIYTFYVKFSTSKNSENFFCLSKMSLLWVGTVFKI